MTPFQFFLAKKIILETKESFSILYLQHGDSEKNDYYAKELTGIVNNIYRYRVKSGNFLAKIIYFLFYLIKNYMIFSNFNKIYFATITDKHIYVFLRFFRYTNLITFDDGLGNIYTEGIFFEETEQLNYIKNRISNHYTIYDGFENIVSKDRLLKISLLDKVENNKNDQDKVVSIFLGQPYEEFLDKSFNLRNFELFLKKIGIDYYYPHPREKERVVDLNYVNTPLIFEDYAVDLLSKYSRLKVYTFTSSAILNICGLENVELYAFKTEHLKFDYLSLYDIFKVQNIKILNIDL